MTVRIFSKRIGIYTQAMTVGASFALFPKLVKNGFTSMPLFSLAFKMSHLLRNRIKVTLESSLEEQIARQRRNESSSLLMLGSSSRRSSKQDMAGEGRNRTLVGFGTWNLGR
jgi:hypothetical protein